MGVTHKPKAGSKLTGTEYGAADSHILALVDGDIPSTIARDSEVTAAISAHAAAADPHGDRAYADSSVSTHAGAADPHPGYLTAAEGAAAYDALGAAAAAQAAAIAASQPLDADLTAIAALTTTAFGRGLLELANAAALLSAAGGAAASHAHAGGDITSGTVAEARIDASIARVDDIPPTPLAPTAPLTMVTAVQTGHGFVEGANCASVDLNDTADYALGTQSLEFTTAGGGALADCHVYGLAPFSLVDRDPVIWLKVDDTTHLASIVLRIGSAAGTAYFGWAWTPSSALPFQSGEWVCLPVPWADYNANTGSSRRDIFTDITIAATDDGAGAVTVHFNGLGWVPKPARSYPKGVVSICFDDGWASTYTIARPLLDAKGFPASVFPIITGTSGIGESGRMTVAQLQELRDRSGWDFGVHAYATQTHADRFTTMSDAALSADLAAARAWHVEKGLPGSHIVGYPGGEWTAASLAVVGRYFSAGRTTYGRTDTQPAMIPLKLRAQSSISSFSGGASAATITGLIDKVIANGGWLTLVFHRLVAADPASTQDCLTSDFTTIVDYLAAKAVPVRTMSQVLAEYPADWADDEGAWRPQDQGYIAWPYDPAAANNTLKLATAGTQYMVKVRVPRRTIVTSIQIVVTTQGGTLTANQCLAGLYQNTKLLGVTGDQSTAWGTQGVKTMALTAPVVVEAGWAYICLMFNGTDGPTITRGASNSNQNSNLGATTYRWATADTGRTTSLADPHGTLSSFTTSLWAALL